MFLLKCRTTTDNFLWDCESILNKQVQESAGFVVAITGLIKHIFIGGEYFKSC